MDLDDVLHHAGDWDRYQHLLLWLVCLPACIPCGFAAFNQVFMDRIPDHWCKVPTLISAEWTAEDRKAASIPKLGTLYSQCSKYDLNYTGILLENSGNKSLDVAAITSCTDGWEYDKVDVPSSVVIDFELVCSKSLYPTLGLSALNVGGLVGVLLFGYLNDRIGRKKNYFLCLTVQIVFGIATAFAPNVVWWIIFRFFVGLTIPAILHIPFVICLEAVAPSKRTLVSFYANMFYVVGLMGFSGLAYSTTQWQLIALSTSVPFVLYYLYIIFLPESMRWLLSRGRVKEVVEMLHKIASVNHRHIPEEMVQKFTETMEHQREQADCLRNGRRANLRDLLQTPNMRMKTLIISLSWVVNETTYVGLSYYGPSMGSDPYLSFFLSSVVEIPGYVFCLLLMDRWGRRMTLCSCMILSGVAAISTALLPTDAEVLTLILYLIAKCTIAGGTMIIFQFGGELYPTEVRGVGIGLASFLGGIGLTLIPFINYLGTQWLVLPIVMMGAFSVAGGIVTLKLPETLGAKLPQTLEEGEDFGKDFKGWVHTIQQMSRLLPKRLGCRDKHQEIVNLEQTGCHQHATCIIPCEHDHDQEL
ncbi:carcinine transporter-like [Daphnia carinata]|uniref:carcinine transporter-like n=1 Tax=Daphnia carinata TaxID=120202 RepID=UPI00257E1F82|nr:carcinine transporter-like [Daphnia carinata]